MTRPRRLWRWGVAVLAVAGALAYLYDPPWLASLTDGLADCWPEDGGPPCRCNLC